MKELNKLAEEIVSRLVDCASADPEPVEQYKEWTRNKIAGAFRALEQRAEAAEAKLNGKSSLLTNEAEEFTKVPPHLEHTLHEDEKNAWISGRNTARDINMGKLVPPDWYFQLTFEIPNMENMTPYQAHSAAWKQCRAAILRNIEEANK